MFYFFGLALSAGAETAAVLATPAVLLPPILLRAINEEAALVKWLDNYRHYIDAVPWRLVPHVL